MVETGRPSEPDDERKLDTAPDAPRTQTSAGEPAEPSRVSTREGLRERETLSARSMARPALLEPTVPAEPPVEPTDSVDETGPEEAWMGSTVDMTMRSMPHPGAPTSGNWDERRVMRLEREVEQLQAAGRLLDKRLARSELAARVALVVALSALLVSVLLEAR